MLISCFAMKILRRLALALSATLISLLLALVAAEIAASTTKAGNAAYYVVDEEMGIVRKPDHEGYTFGNGRWIAVRINREGLRGDDLPAERDPAERRILCIGDSFTFGGGVETHEAWPQQLQERLGTPEASRIRVLNGGANGWDTAWQRQYLEIRGIARFEPEIVILGFNWNDLEIDPDAPQAAVENFILCENSPILGPFARFPALRATHLFRWLYAREMGSEHVRSEEDLVRDYARYAERREVQALAPERAATAFRERRFGAAEPDLQFWTVTDTPNWKLVRAEMTRIAALCREKGVKLLVALFPEPTWDGPGTFPATERMTVMLDYLGVPWVDVQPAFLERDETGAWKGKGQDLWLRHDPFHPTPKGQAILADQVLAKLRQLGWVPAR
jgi:lysophospholipase L1-like esterase